MLSFPDASLGSSPGSGLQVEGLDLTLAATLSSPFRPSHHGKKGDGYVTLWYIQREALMKKILPLQALLFDSKLRIEISEERYFSHVLH